jgi:hypothetical protein
LRALLISPSTTRSVSLTLPFLHSLVGDALTSPGRKSDVSPSTTKPLSPQEDKETVRSRLFTEATKNEIQRVGFMEVKPFGDWGTRRRSTTAFRQNYHDHHHLMLFLERFPYIIEMERHGSSFLRPLRTPHGHRNTRVTSRCPMIRVQDNDTLFGLSRRPVSVRWLPEKQQLQRIAREKRDLPQFCF